MAVGACDNMELKHQIKHYWQDKQPNKWYSDRQKYQSDREYYEAIEKKKYEYFYPHIKLMAEFDQHKNEKILEVGIGMGIDLLQYAKNGAVCYGIDLTEGAIEETKKLFQAFSLNADLQVMDAETLQFEDNTFDLVCSFGVLHHTPNTQKAINEIFRVLKPKGKAIILLYSKSWQHYAIMVGIAGIIGLELLKMSMQELINKYSEAYGFSPLTKLYSKKEIKQMFSSFKDVEISHFHYQNNFFQRRYLQGNWIIKAVKK